MKSTPNKAANAPVLNANQKLHDLVLEYLAVTIEALDWSMVETMEVLLDILTPEDMEQLGLGDTMREYLTADDKDEE